MTIEKLEEFASNGDKHLTGLDVATGFPRADKPERPWFNKLFGDITKKTNELINYRNSDEETKLIASNGFAIVDSFELGATLTQRNEALRHTADGKPYRWAGDLPKTVPVGSTPTSSGGFGDNAWLEVSDAALRYELTVRDVSSGGGAVAIKGAAVMVDSLIDLLNIDVSKVDNGQIVVLGQYFSGTGTGGGVFYWDTGRPKKEADGGLVIDPDNIGEFNGNVATHESFFRSQGDYVGAKPWEHLNPNISTENGCWVRADANEYNIHYFGASPSHNSSPALSSALRQARLKNNQTVYVPRGIYEIDGGVTVALQTNDFTFRGDGKGQSVLIIKEAPFLIGCYPESIEQDYHYRNFIVRGLTFKSDPVQPSSLIMDIVRHDAMEVHDCEFIEVQGANHIIDFAGSSTLKVFNCDFLGRLGDLRPFSECIQIAPDTGSGLGGFEDWADNLKGLSPKRVDIVNCRFVPYILPDGIVSSGSATPFGNHGTMGEDCEFVVRDTEIWGNNNKDTQYAYTGGAVLGLSLWGAKSVLLENVKYHGEWTINTSANYLRFTDIKEVILRDCDFNFKITNETNNEFSNVTNVSKFTMDNCTFEVDASNNAHGLFTYYTNAAISISPVSATEFTFINSTIKSNIPGDWGRGLLRIVRITSPSLLHLKLNVSNCNLIYSGAGPSRLVMFGGGNTTPTGIVDGVIANNTFIGCEQLDHPTNWEYKWIIKDNTFDNMSGQIYKTETTARGNLVASDSTATAISQDSSVANGGLLNLL